MSEKDSIALYVGNVAVSLSYSQINDAIRHGIEITTDASPEAADALAATTTSLASGLLVGLLASKAGIDVPAEQFNVRSVLGTVMMVGYTLAYGTKAINLTVKYLSL